MWRPIPTALTAILVALPFSADAKETAKTITSFPATMPNVPQGTAVLAADPRDVASLAEKAPADVSVILSYATLDEPGEKTSKVRDLGTIEEVPNALVIPMDPDAQASPGDIVLTWRKPGGKIERAIVVGGTAAEPTVRYLDGYVSRDGSVDDQEVKLGAGSFRRITSGWCIGARVTIPGRHGRRFGTVIGVTQKDVLVQYFMSNLGRFAKEDVQLVSLAAELTKGQAVSFNRSTWQSSGVVRKVDPRIGRVWVEYESGGETDVYAVSVGNVLAKQNAR
ncbi:MAG: hypothetical protein AAFX06_09155 [Planctomycetota bacterium]